VPLHLLAFLMAMSLSTSPTPNVSDRGGDIFSSQATQEEQTAKEGAIFFSGFFDLGFASLKSTRASLMRTGESGLTFGLGFGAVVFSYLDFSAGFGLVFLEDRDPFSQLTTGGEATSSVSIGIYYAQVGFQLPVPFRNKRGDFPVWVGGKLGLMGTGASRDISNCADCYVEKLKFSGGAYLKPEFKLKIGHRVWIGAAYTFFSSKADFLNMFGVTLSGNFN